MSDMQWFRANPRANFRIRKPDKGEVEALISAVVPFCTLQIALPPPADTVEWNVLVIRAGKTPVRLLVLRDKDDKFAAAQETFDLSALGIVAAMVGPRLVLAP